MTRMYPYPWDRNVFLVTCFFHPFTRCLDPREKKTIKESVAMPSVSRHQVTDQDIGNTRSWGFEKAGTRACNYVNVSRNVFYCFVGNNEERNRRENQPLVTKVSAHHFHALKLSAGALSRALADVHSLRQLRANTGRHTTVATGTSPAPSNHLWKQLNRVSIHDQILADFGRPVKDGIDLVFRAGAKIPDVTVPQGVGSIRLKLHIWIWPPRAHVRARLIRAGSRLGTGSNIEVEKGTSEDPEGRLRLVSRDGMTGLVGADVTQVSVLADEAADVGVVCLDLGVLRRCIPGGPCPVDCLGHGITAAPL